MGDIFLLFLIKEFMNSTNGKSAKIPYFTGVEKL